LAAMTEIARENLHTYREVMKRRYDSKVLGVRFHQNDKVYLTDHRQPKGLSRKLLPKFAGPLVVEQQVLGTPNYILRSEQTGKLLQHPVHVNRLQKCHERRRYEPTLDIIEEQGDDVQEDGEVEEVIQAAPEPVLPPIPDAGIENTAPQEDGETIEQENRTPVDTEPPDAAAPDSNDAAPTVENEADNGDEEIDLGQEIQMVDRKITKVVKGKRDASGRLYYNILFDHNDPNECLGEWIPETELSEMERGVGENSSCRIFRSKPKQLE